MPKHGPSHYCILTNLNCCEYGQQVSFAINWAMPSSFQGHVVWSDIWIQIQEENLPSRDFASHEVFGVVIKVFFLHLLVHWMTCRPKILRGNQHIQQAMFVNNSLKWSRCKRMVRLCMSSTLLEHTSVSALPCVWTFGIGCSASDDSHILGVWWCIL